MIVAIAGPSGVGKSWLSSIAVSDLGFDYVPAVTTRQRRLDESPDQSYEYIERSEFHERIRSGVLIDWDYTVGEYYGYPDRIREYAGASRHIAIVVVARMAVRLSSRLDGMCLLFLDGVDTRLDTRVAGRGVESSERRLRLLHREEERAHAELFDLVARDADGLSHADGVALLAQALDAAGDRRRGR